LGLPAAAVGLSIGTEGHGVTGQRLNTIPIPLMRDLRDRYHLQQFVETGTYQGASALKALAYFDRVITCDLDPELICRFANLKLPGPKYLTALCMDSHQMLGEVFANPCLLPALVWLDAHWMGGPKLGPECPLLDELRAIGGTRGRHVVLIDDARLFLAPPPPPHDPREWPTFAEIVALCRELGPTDLVEVVGDVITVCPQEPSRT
jgi:hypothetical protein